MPTLIYLTAEEVIRINVQVLRQAGQVTMCAWGEEGEEGEGKGGVDPDMSCSFSRPRASVARAASHCALAGRVGRQRWRDGARWGGNLCHRVRRQRMHPDGRSCTVRRQTICCPCAPAAARCTTCREGARLAAAGAQRPRCLVGGSAERGRARYGVTSRSGVRHSLLASRRASGWDAFVSCPRVSLPSPSAVHRSGLPAALAAPRVSRTLADTSLNSSGSSAASGSPSPVEPNA